MHLTFLGTSAGVPTIQRNVTALAVSPSNSRRWYLVDCGEATQHRLMHTSLSLVQLEAVLITHVHGDHCYGLPGLLATAATQGRIEPLTIVAPRAIREYLDTVFRLTAVTLPYALSFHAVEDLDGLQTPDFMLHRVVLSHRVPSHAYVFTEIDRSPRIDTDKLAALSVPRGPAWGQLQAGIDVVLEDGRHIYASDVIHEKKLRRLIIGGDNDRPELLADAAHNVDLLVHEATYTKEVAMAVEPGPQHCSAASIATFAQSANIPNLILTHFSQRYHRPHDATLEPIRREAVEHYHGNLFLAQDLDQYTLSTDGYVSFTGSLRSAITQL